MGLAGDGSVMESREDIDAEGAVPVLGGPGERFHLEIKWLLRSQNYLRRSWLWVSSCPEIRRHHLEVKGACKYLMLALQHISVV